MDKNQKQRLRFYQKARKRAEKVLAGQHMTEQKKLDHKLRVLKNQEAKESFRCQLVALAEQSGILALAQRAAAARGGVFTQELSCYVDYGMSSTNLNQAMLDETHGELRPSHLALRIIWGQPEALQAVEIYVHPNGNINFHNQIVPVLPLAWRIFPQLLNTMLERALNHPRPHVADAKTPSA